jgi:hypothetical protein
MEYSKTEYHMSIRGITLVYHNYILFFRFTADKILKRVQVSSWKFIVYFDVWCQNSFPSLPT